MLHFSPLTVLNGKRLTVFPLIGIHRNTLTCLHRYNFVKEYRIRHHRFFPAMYPVGKSLSYYLPDSLMPCHRRHVRKYH